MWPAPSWSSSRGWPKLDLPRHIGRLTLALIVPYSEEAAERFGPVLDTNGSFISVLSSSKHRFKHHCIESARLGFDEIIGTHGVKNPVDDDDSGGHSFTLDRGADGTLALAVDISVPLEGELAQASERAQRKH